MRSARRRSCPTRTRPRTAGGTFDTLTGNVRWRDEPAAGRVADATGNWVDGLAPAWTRPICGWPVSTGRSARGCCCCRAGGRSALAAIAARAAEPISGTSCCSSSAPSPCAAPAAPGTTSSTATSTPGSSARARGRFPSGQVSGARGGGFLVLQALVGLRCCCSSTASPSASASPRSSWSRSIRS